MKLPLALFGTACLIVGAAAYIYMTYAYREQDASIDLLGEDETQYL
ncbi:hypothetical protein [Pontibacter arcticus]|nr:hypothetical protein [Pontibacter arcticus]